MAAVQAAPFALRALHAPPLQVPIAVQISPPAHEEPRPARGVHVDPPSWATQRRWVRHDLSRQGSASSATFVVHLPPPADEHSTPSTHWSEKVES